jgi:hypothetical protein
MDGDGPGLIRNVLQRRDDGAQLHPVVRRVRGAAAKFRDVVIVGHDDRAPAAGSGIARRRAGGEDDDWQDLILSNHRRRNSPVWQSSGDPRYQPLLTDEDDGALLRIERASRSSRGCGRFRTSREAPERPQLPSDRSSAARPHVRGATAPGGCQRVRIEAPDAHQPAGPPHHVRRAPQARIERDP